MVFSDINHTKKYPLHVRLYQREMLLYYKSILHKDRKSINLSGINHQDKHTFLSLGGYCKTCKREKKLWQYFNKETSTINDTCNNCNIKKEVYSILLDLFED